MRSGTAVLGVLLSLLVTACQGLGNQALEAGNVGLQLEVISGDNQSASPGVVYRSALAVRLSDPTGTNPVAGSTVIFTEVTGTDAQVLIGEAQTDALGVAVTQVVSARIYNRTTKIQAQLADSNTAVSFTLTTTDKGAGARFDVSTTHNQQETAGVPFGFFVKIVDDMGNVVTDYEGTLVLTFSFDTTSSWGGVAPVLPDVGTVCTFVHGVCTLPANYTLTDSRRATLIYVGDGPGGFQDVFAKPIVVTAGAAAGVTIADIPGGPSAGAVARSSLTSIKKFTTTADSATSRMTAVSIDLAGNYIGDISNATWSISGESAVGVLGTHFAPSLPATTASLSLTPVKTGTGRLTLSKSGLTSTSVDVRVDPGKPTHLLVVTANSVVTNDVVTSAIERPGFPFTIQIFAKDQHENTVTKDINGANEYIGQFTAKYEFLNPYSAKVVSGGCARLFPASETSNSQIYGDPENCNGGANNLNVSQVFFSGAGILTMKGLLNDAHAVSPSLKVTVAPGNGFSSSLTGITPITISRGPAFAINLHAASGDDGSFYASSIALAGTDRAGANNGSHYPASVPVVTLSKTSGTGPFTYFAAYEDKGGNFISQATVNWSTTLALVGQFSPDTGGSASQSTVLTPTTAGSGVLHATDGTLSSDFGGTINASALHHFELSASDGSSSLNTIKATRTYSLFIQGYDVLGNPASITGANTNLTFVTTGLTNSPKGNSSVAPSSGTYTTDVGNSTRITVGGLRIRNSLNTVDISVNSPGVVAPVHLSPTLAAGPQADLRIRTVNDLSACNASNAADVTSTSGTHAGLSYTTDDSPTFYFAPCDSEQNTIPNTANGNWTFISSVPSAATTTAQPSFGFNVSPTLPTSASLSLTFNGATATSVPITIGSGVVFSLAVTTVQSGNPSGTVTAGKTFTTSVVMKDSRSNTVNFTGSTALNLSVTNSANTVYGNNFTAPGSGTRNFVNGVMTPDTLTLFNAATTPTITYTTVGDATIPASVSGAAPSMTVLNDGLDHFRILQRSNTLVAGQNTIFDLKGVDRWGNTQTTDTGDSGPTRAVRVVLASALGGQAINAATGFSGSSISGGSTLTGNLIAGSGAIQVTAQRTGTLTLAADINGLPAIPRAHNGSDYVESVTVLPEPILNVLQFKSGFSPLAAYSASSSAPMTPFKVEMYDQYTNLINNSPTVMSINATPISGSGSLTGTLTATTASGVATFSNVIYDQAINPLVFQISANLGGQTRTLNSGPIDASGTVDFSTATQTVSESIGTVTVTANLSSLHTNIVSVPFTVSGTATSTDHDLVAGTISIPAGSLTGSTTFHVLNDALYENSETVIVTMGTPTNVAKGTVTVQTITITDDDPMPTVSFSIASQTVSESVGTVTVTVNQSAPSSLDTTIPLTLTGTATLGAGNDYTISPSTLTVPAGSTSASTTITILDDTLYENTETIILTMGTLVNAAAGATTVHTVTITDNDSPPTVTFAAGSQLVSEGDGIVTVRLSLSTASGLDVSVPYVVSGTAANPARHNAASGTAVITAGTTSKDISFTLVDDLILEPDQTVVFTMGTPVNATAGARTVHTVTITDNDTAPVVTFAAASQTVTEAVGTVTLTVNQSRVSGVATTIPFTVTGTATNPSDHNAASGSITIAAGATSSTYSFNVVDDSLYEVAETVIFTMGTPTNAIQGATTVHTVTITDNDTMPTVTFSASSQTVSEAVGTVTVTATQSAVSGADTTIPLTLTGTATGGGVDYSISPSSITILAGSLSGSTTITVVNDTLYESNETIILTMGTLVNASAGATTVQTVTITDNDPVPTVAFSTATQAVNKTAGTVTVTVNQSAASGFTTTIPFTVSGTATAGAGNDYTISSSSITIPAGSTSGSTTFTVINGATYKVSRTVILTMGTPTNASQGATTAQTVTISDTLPTVTFSIAAQSVSENVGTVTVTVNQSSVSTLDTTIPFALSGTATQGAGNDYTLPASPLTISAGQTSVSTTVTIVDDAIYEATETIVLTMGTLVNATAGARTTHTITILDNDTAPTVSFSAATQSVSEAVGTVTVTVNQSAVTGATTTIPYTVRKLPLAGAGTANDPADYHLVDGSLTIAAGAQSANFTFNVVNDTIHENDETIVIDLGTPTNATLGATPTQTITILDNDAAPVVSFVSASQQVSEADGVVTVRLSIPAVSGLDVSVPYVVSGTAANPARHNAASGTAVITAGTTSNDISFTLVDDLIVQSNQTVIFTMGTPVNATAGTRTVHTVTIIDDDSPILTFSPAGPYDYGTVGTDTPGSFLLTNSGHTTTTGNLVITLTDSHSMFALSTENCSGAALNPATVLNDPLPPNNPLPMGSCKIVVNFKGASGSTSGLSTATLSVDGGSGITTAITLTGTK